MYLGTFDSFRFSAAADTPVNTIITAGGYVGVTRDNVAAGETGLAFLGKPVSVYTFAITALAENKDLGTAVYIDGDGAITFNANDGAAQNPTAYTQIGTLWKAGTAGDTEITVALK